MDVEPAQPPAKMVSLQVELPLPAFQGSLLKISGPLHKVVQLLKDVSRLQALSGLALSGSASMLELR